MKYSYRIGLMLGSVVFIVSFIIGLWSWNQNIKKRTDPSQTDNSRRAPMDESGMTNGHSENIVRLSKINDDEWQQMPKVRICFYEKTAEAVLVPAFLKELSLEGIGRNEKMPQPAFEVHGAIDLPTSAKSCRYLEIGIVPASYDKKGKSLFILGTTYRIINKQYGGEVCFALPEKLDGSTVLLVDYIINEKKELPPPQPAISGQISDSLIGGEKKWIVHYSKTPKRLGNFLQDDPCVKPANPDGSFLFKPVSLSGDLYISLSETPGKIIKIYKRKTLSEKAFHFPDDADFIIQAEEKDLVDCQFKFSDGFPLQDMGYVQLYKDKEDVFHIFEGGLPRQCNIALQRRKFITVKALPGEYWAMAVTDYGSANDYNNDSMCKSWSEMKITVSGDSGKNIFTFPTPEKAKEKTVGHNQ